MPSKGRGGKRPVGNRTGENPFCRSASRGFVEGAGGDAAGYGEREGKAGGKDVGGKVGGAEVAGGKTGADSGPSWSLASD